MKKTTKGGARPGAGRKARPLPRKDRTYRADADELASIQKRFADQLGMTAAQALLAYSRGEWQATRTDKTTGV